MAQGVAEPGRDEATPQSGAGAPLPPPERFGWLGLAIALLALAAWMAQLGASWLAPAAAGTLGWSVLAGRRGRPHAVAALALWAAIGGAAVAQHRLAQIAADWTTVSERVEERAATALRGSLDELFDRGIGAVEAVESAVPRAGASGRGLFDALERVRDRERVSALAVYDADGLPVAWAGDHRGMIPQSVRRGQAASAFSDGPLFQYLYFTRNVGGGRTAVAAVLLQATVDAGRGEPPFAERFARVHGIDPRFTSPERARGDALWDWSTSDGPIFSVSFGALTQQQWWDRIAQQGRWTTLAGWAAAWLVGMLLWYRRRIGPAWLPVVLTTAALLLMPAGALFGAEALFSPMRFLLPVPGSPTLGDTLILLAGVAVWLLALGDRVRGGRALPAPLLVLPAAAAFPLVVHLLRTSAAPGPLAAAPGGGFALQLAGVLALALPLFVVLRLSERGTSEAGASVTWLGLALATAMGLGLLVAWRPDRPLPLALTALWVAPFALVVRGRAPWRGVLRTLGAWVAVGWIAATLVLPSLWNQHLGVRMELAEDELARLGTEPDPYLDFLLRQFAESALALAAEGEGGVNLLYRAWVASGLATEGEEARLTVWRGLEPEAELRLSDMRLPLQIMEELVPEAAAAEGPILRRYDRIDPLHYLLLVPMVDQRVVTVAVPPRRYLGRSTVLAGFLDARAAPLDDDRQVLTLVPAAAQAAHAQVHRDTIVWNRAADGWRSETEVAYPSGPAHAHLLLRAPTLPLLVARGLIVLAGALLALAALWATARTLCGEPFALTIGARRATRSFRGRLTLALFGFFLVPTLAFGAVAYGAVSREVVRTAAALARRSLQEAIGVLQVDAVSRLDPRMGRDLVLYRDGVLVDAVAPEALDLGLFQTWLPPEVMLAFRSGEHAEALEERRVGGSSYLVAYQRLNAEEVIGAPIALASGEIARRQREFTDVIVLVALLGAALSIALSLAVGRALTRPIEQLSRAAAAVGGGNLGVRLADTRSDEFGGVYRSFNRMIGRLRRTRAALLRETRRTELIVAEAATGVLALDAGGRVALVNPRAQEILGGPLAAGAVLPPANPLLAAVAATVRDFVAAGATERGEEIEVDGRMIRMRLRRLPAVDGVMGGAVLALEDITSEIRSARVLAWGEMARQVAHEIKNPLTPIKLSVQHLRRAYADRRPDYETILNNNVDSVLREIDRLGQIARAFARFGAPAADGGEVERIDAAAVVRETLALYRGGDDGIEYLDAVDAGTPPALARPGELKEVLVNLLENAREALGAAGRIEIRVAPAGAGEWVAIDVADTGEGIPEALLPRIFDPHFSTRSSGTGLGLAIVRRLVEGWGGEVTADSAAGQGTTVHIRLRGAGGGGDGAMA